MRLSSCEKQAPARWGPPVQATTDRIPSNSLVTCTTVPSYYACVCRLYYQCSRLGLGGASKTTRIEMVSIWKYLTRQELKYIHHPRLMNHPKHHVTTTNHSSYHQTPHFIQRKGGAVGRGMCMKVKRFPKILRLSYNWAVLTGYCGTTTPSGDV